MNWRLWKLLLALLAGCSSNAPMIAKPRLVLSPHLENPIFLFGRNRCPLLIVGMLAAASLCAASIAWTQTYPFHRYTTSEGLSHAAVRKVFQDSRGMLWFGTDGGVDNYDGRAFNENLTSNSNPTPVHEIFEDGSGTLWIGTYGFGLVKLHPSSAQPAGSVIDTILPGYVTAIAADVHGTVWVGSDEGLFAFERNGRRIRVRGLEGVGEIYALVVDTSGTIWAGTHRGLFAGQGGDPDSMSFRHILLRPTRSLLLRRNGEVLAGTSGSGNDQDGFVCRLTGEAPDTILSYATTKSLIKAQSLWEDTEGTLWVGTGYGLYMIKEGRITHLRTEHGLQNENIYDIMQDAEGTMWFGTENGVIKLTLPCIINYGMKEGLTGYDVLSGLRDRKGNLWFGMWNGLNRIDHRGHVTRWDQVSGLPHHTVRAIAEDVGGRILVGTLRGLAAVTHDRAMRLNIRGIPRELDVWSVYCEAASTIWIGGGGTLYKTRNGMLEHEFPLGEGIAGGAVEVQCRDRRDRLWVVAGGRTAYVFDPHGAAVPVRAAVDPAHQRIHSIHEHSGGTLWFCTNKGVMVLEGDSLRFDSTLGSPLLRNSVYFAIEAAGATWFGTEHGVLSWDGERLRQFTTADGLASDIVTTACLGHDGTLWFGTHGGISVLGPAGLKYNAPIPHVYLDPVLCGDGMESVEKQETIPYDKRTIVFRFNALSYVAEREMLFQWMVDGFDREWQEPRKERQVRYTNLGPGEYVFKVRAANRNGEWSQPAAYLFVIRPPFWRTWWFIALSSLLAASVLTLAYRYRVNQLLQMERMRRRIAADLHDDIASSLSSMGIYAAVIQRQLREVPEDVSVLLDRIRELSRDTMENIGLIVWSIDPRRDELKEVFRYFQRYSEQLCKAAGVEFVSRLPEVVTSVLLAPEHRRTLFLILKEALNNSLRHSHCGRIEFGCSLHGRTLKLTLTDDGSGFIEVAGEGHGLHNMRSRAETIGALVDVASTPGRGTTVSLKLRIA